MCTIVADATTTSKETTTQPADYSYNLEMLGQVALTYGVVSNGSLSEADISVTVNALNQNDSTRAGNTDDSVRADNPDDSTRAGNTDDKTAGGNTDVNRATMEERKRKRRQMPKENFTSVINKKSDKENKKRKQNKKISSLEKESDSKNYSRLNKRSRPNTQTYDINEDAVQITSQMTDENNRTDNGNVPTSGNILRMVTENGETFLVTCNINTEIVDELDTFVFS